MLTKPLVSKSDWIEDYFKRNPKDNHEFFFKGNMVAPCATGDGWMMLSLSKSARKAYYQSHQPKNLIWDGDAQFWSTNEGTTDKTLQRIDLKVFVGMEGWEFPFGLPDHMFKDGSGNVRPGYHTLELHMTEEELDGLYTWAVSHGGILKIIGSETVII